MLHVVLVEPEIPPNTGNVARLCMATQTRLHLVEPLGFSIDDKTLRRAGMDYWHSCDVVSWRSWDAFASANTDERLFFLTTKTSHSLWNASFQDGDYLVFGRETKGLPESLLAANPDACVRIPMADDARSLNLSTAVGIVLYEALRQTAPHTESPPLK